MKKVLSAAVALLFAGAVMAQTIVSTSPENRNVIIEEYTGVNCTYCPDGHRRANEIVAANPGHAWAINIHTGGYAVQYFTQWGAALANQTGLTGYPSGTVNRHIFPDLLDYQETPPHTVTAQSRGNWADAASQIRAMSSPVNVAAEGEIVGRTLATPPTCSMWLWCRTTSSARR